MHVPSACCTAGLVRSPPPSAVRKGPSAVQFSCTTQCFLCCCPSRSACVLATGAWCCCISVCSSTLLPVHVCVCVQVGAFSRLLEENGRPAVRRVHVDKEGLSGLLKRYKTALQQLKDDVEGIHT